MNDKNRSNCPFAAVDRPSPDCDRLRDAHRVRLTWDHLIATVALRIRQSLQLEEILQVTAREVQGLLKCDRVLLYELLDSEGDGRIAVETVADSRWSLAGQTIQDRCFKDRCESYAEGQVFAIADITTTSLDPCYHEFLQTLQVRANLGVPLFQDDRLWGLIIAHHCTEPRSWQEEEMRGLQQIALQVGIALNQAALIDQLRRAKADLEGQVSARTAELDRVNQELRQRNDVLQNAVVGISKLNPQGRYQNLNLAYARACGYEPEDLVGQPWQQTVHPDDIPFLEGQYQVMLETGQVEVEARGVRRDGSTFYKRVTMIADYDAGGEFVGHHCFMKDISEHKQAEIALRSKTEELDRFFSVTLDLLTIADIKGRFLRLNQQWEKTLGYAIAELKGKHFIDYVHPDDRDKTIAATQRLLDGQEVINFINRYRCRDGSYCWLEWRSIPVGNRIYAAARDITQRQAIEWALKRSEAQLSGVLNSSLDGIMAFESLRDETGAIVDFIGLLSNPKACELVGRSPEQLIGKQLLAELPGNKTDGLFDAYVEVVETGKPYKGEFHYHHDNIDGWFENIAVKLEDGFAVTFRDVTQIKESEQKLQEMNREIGARLDDLKQRHAEMIGLNEMSDFLQACTTVEEAWEAIAHLVEPLFPNCSGGLFVTCNSRNRVENVARWGSQFHSASEFPPQDCWGLRRGRIYEVGVHRSGPRCRHISTDGPAVTLCIPMVAQGETLGLLHLNAETAEALPEPKQQLARTVAEHLSLAIANLNLRETLHHQSICDPLTGLFNRRYLDEVLNQEIARAQRRQQTIGIIMLDIDHFKRFNDTFGHEAGDCVLRAVGELLRKSVRVSDIPCRYGGEEMTIVLPEASLSQTRDRAEVIRTAIGGLNLSHNSQPFGTVTASLGVAAFPRHGTTGMAVIQAADAALYRAKAAGRNCAILAP